MANGSIGAATTDAVTISIDGGDYAAARWIVDTAGTATVTTEVTSDFINWRPAPYSQRVDAVSANPQVAAWQDAAPAAGSYDTPLPANTKGFRVRCGTIGTATALRVQAGRPYMDNEPVMAVLFDVTSALNTQVDTGVLETAGWRNVDFYIRTPVGGSATVKQADDTGADTAALLVVGQSSDAFASFGSASADIGQVQPGAGNTYSGGLPLTKRLHANSVAVAGLASRVRVEARRG